MGYFLLLLGLILAGLWYVQRWSRAVGPERTKQALKKIGFGALVVVAIGLAIRSGSALVALLPVLAVAFNRILALLSVLARWTPLPHWLASHFARRSSQRSSASTRSSTATSSISTRYFAMTLDQAQGLFDGTVLLGPHAGELLSTLRLPVLLELHREAADDPQSQAVLEAFLDYRFGDSWKQQGHSDGSAPNLNANMTAAQAYSVLGLQTGASVDEIRHAHRHLSQRLHPDQGGNDALCSLINQARDVLLKQTGKATHDF
jgi:hypothetical protein